MKNILLTLMMMLSLCLHAQEAPTPYYFNSLNVDDGLSNNSVNAILQDKRGMLWFGTKDGLTLYNGISCRTFRKENSPLGNNFITVLHEAMDGRIWIGTDGGAYIYDPQNESIGNLQDCVECKVGDLEHTVSYIGSATDGSIWVAFNELGLFRYDRARGRLTEIEMQHDGQKLTANISLIDFRKDQQAEALSNGRIWLAYYEDNLYYTTPQENGKCHPYTANGGGQPFRGLEINCGLVDLNNYSYIGTNQGLYAIDHRDNSVRCIVKEYVRTCCVDGAGQLWVGTENGLFILNPVTMNVRHLLATYIHDHYSLSDNAIYCICRDHEDGMWIGSYFGGVNYYNAQNSIFRKTYPNECTPLVGKRVREICPGLTGTLWVGTEDRGLFTYDKSTGEIQPFSHPELYHNIHGLCRVDDELWVGTFSGGLSRINLHTKNLKHYKRGDGPGQLATGSVFCICHTHGGETLLGSIGGIYRYREEDDSFEYLPDLKGEFVYYILEDHLGNIWYATYNSGVYCKDIRTGRLEHFMPDENNPQSIPHRKVTSLFEDSRYRIWVATQGGGCCCYDTRAKQFRRYDTSNGFPSNVVMRIVEDQQGTLWFTTNQGLVSMKAETFDAKSAGEGLRLFTTTNGLLSDQFNYQSGLVDIDGTIYLGSIDGLISFRPQDIRRGSVPPPLVLSDFYIFNDRAEITPDGGVLNTSIMFADEVQLAVDQNTFSLRASVLSYASPMMNKIHYRLEGYEEGWQTLVGTDLISYANLPYGNYTLHIKGESYDGQETEERILYIHIRPPFYLTPWAYLVYVLLVCAVGYTLYKYMHGKTLRRHELEMDHLKQENERELYGAKIEFFTNVAHEIRTPLTLIKTPLENVLTSPGVTPDMQDDLEVMQLNTERLLDLVNELLDFRKTEAKGFQMHFTECDLAQMLQRIHTRFTPFARQQGLELTIECPDSLLASVDSEGFTKITSNLLTNAIKYSSTYVSVKLQATDKNVELRVTNDGDIVPLQMREEIFKSFTRYYDESTPQKPGSGVGLTLARSLAELHEGTLQMDGDLSCNRFILTLPLKHDDNTETEVDAIQRIEPQEAEPTSEQSAHTLLVVEDNLEMQTFVRRQLISYYRVLTASNGQQALEVLAREMVHLIISDVMMPVMDGMELCNRVKSDINYSHIPVILLTAKVGIQAKIEGLQQGADAYIEKPFSIEYLRVSVNNLLKNREQLRTTYRNSPLAQTSTMDITKADEEFLGRLHTVIMSNMKDSEFSIDQMASELAMSRSSLNRKIKALLDVSPNDYVRIERLKYAAELLQQGRYKINEVCYMAGFNTPSYFAKCFQKQFGVLPNEYVKS